MREILVTVTIKDVARIAGCSIKTVSRVVNNEPYVTDDLRARVQAAIRTTGYAPNISARRLVTRKAFMVCVLLYPGFQESASGILSRILDLTYEEDYDILIQPFFPTHKHSRNRLVGMVSERRVDGFVITPPCDADGFVTDLLATYQVPFVLINPLNHEGRVPFVTGDDYNGAYAMTGHLAALHHRRIGFLMGPRNLRASLDRFYGYRAALDARGLPFEERWVEDAENTFDGGITAARLLVGRQLRPTAIFGGNDEAALGAMYALQEMGLRVPQDLSVCGYGDTPPSRSVWPGLTTVHQPAEEMIQMATQMLIQVLKGQALEKTEVLLPAQLVIRGSTASPSSAS